jgi:hypothetical protein
MRFTLTLLTLSFLVLQLGCSNKGYVAPDNTITASEANAKPGLPENQRPSGYPSDTTKMGGGKTGGGGYPGGGGPPTPGGPPSK